MRPIANPNNVKCSGCNDEIASYTDNSGGYYCHKCAGIVGKIL